MNERLTGSKRVKACYGDVTTATLLRCAKSTAFIDLPPFTDVRFARVIDQTISHYRILEKLGGGGMGVVYEAQDETLGRHVALKFLPPELSSDASALERFQREARAASALNHPNICTIHEIGQQNGQYFIVMELLEGMTLRERILGKPVLTDQGCSNGRRRRQCFEPLSARASSRDVEPANIFVDEARSRQDPRLRPG